MRGASARRLARKIIAYKEKFPHQEVNIIGLSAGSGVAIWALEELAGQEKVDHVFMVGSSMSSSYNLRPALKSVKGRVHVYYSPHDAILKSVQLFALGTIDRRLEQAAGQVGFSGLGSDSPRLENIGWEPKWQRLGWHGAHTDCIQKRFVQYEIAPKIMGLYSEQELGEKQTNTRPKESSHPQRKPEPDHITVK